MIVSPESTPDMLRREGYQLACTLEIGNAIDFPTDILLRPDQEFYEAEVEPDEGPFVEQFENATRMHDDDFLEARLEDQISGWGE